ncbi:unnamed protein product [Rhodiola kirilowii]
MKRSSISIDTNYQQPFEAISKFSHNLTQDLFLDRCESSTTSCGGQPDMLGGYLSFHAPTSLSSTQATNVSFDLGTRPPPSGSSPIPDHHFSCNNSIFPSISTSMFLNGSSSARPSSAISDINPSMGSFDWDQQQNSINTCSSFPWELMAAAKISSSQLDEAKWSEYLQTTSSPFGTMHSGNSNYTQNLFSDNIGGEILIKPAGSSSHYGSSSTGASLLWHHQMNQQQQQSSPSHEAYAKDLQRLTMAFEHTF